MKTILLILATFAALSACCLLLVGGCDFRETGERLVENLNSSAQMLEEIQKIQFDSDTTIIPQPYQPDPCPPCPDTVWLNLDSANLRLEWIDFRDTLTQMPKGRWVTSRFICNWCEMREHLETWPDSVFVLSKTPEKEE